jgi:hypothetical protein
MFGICVWEQTKPLGYGLIPNEYHANTNCVHVKNMHAVQFTVWNLHLERHLTEIAAPTGSMVF